MAVDISTLGIEVKSDSVGTATDRLVTLTKTGASAEESTARISAAFDKLSATTISLNKYIEAVTSSLRTMEGSVTTATDRINKLAAEKENASNNGKKLTDSNDKLNNSYKDLCMYAKLAAELFAAWKLAELIKDVTLLAARYETLGVVMQVVGNNAGYTGEQMLKFQAGLQKTGISAIEARQGLVLMGQAQVDMSKSAQLARVAQDAAVIANTNSSEAFNRMMTGISTGTSVILHHMGLMVSFGKAEHDFALEIGKTAEELTVQEKTQARVNEVMRVSVGIAGSYEAAMGTTGKALTSVKRFSDDLKVSLGEAFGPALTTLVDELTRALKDANEAVKNNKSATQTFGSDLNTLISGTLTVFKVDLSKINALLFDMASGLYLLAAVAEAPGRIFGNDLYNKTIAQSKAYADLATNARQYAEAAQAVASVKGPVLDPSEQGRANVAKDDAENKRIAASNKLKAEAAAEAAREAAEKSAQEARELAEKQAMYNKQLLEAESALKQQYLANDKHREESALKDRLTMLQSEKDAGLKTTADFLNEKYDLERAAWQKELDASNKQLAARAQDYYKVSADPGADRIMQVNAEKEYAKALGASLAIVVKMNAATVKKVADNSQLQRDNEHFEAEQKIQRLQAEGNVLAAQDAANALKYSDMKKKGYTDEQIALVKINDSIKEANDLYTKQVAVATELAQLNASNAAKEASLVGVNPATGSIDSIAAAVEHDMAVQKQAHQAKLDMIQAEQDAAQHAYEISSKSKEDEARLIGILIAKSKEKSLEEQDNTGKTSAITKKAYDSQLGAASYYTGLAGGLFNELAGAMDKTNRSGFEAAKAFSLAATTVNTAAAVMNALATVQPYPAAIAAAAAAAATGAIQLGLIASTEFGGGGSVSVPGSFSGAAGGGASSAGSSIGADIKYGADATSSDSMATLADSAKSASLAVGDLASAFKKATDAFSKGGIGGNIIDRLMELAAHPATNNPLVNAVLIAQDKQFSGGLNALMQSNLALIDKAATALGTSTSGTPNIQPKMWDGGEWNKENVTKFFNDFLTGTMNDYAKTVKGLEEFAKPGEDAAAALQRLSSALYDTNKQFDKLGINLLQGLGGANIASKLQDAFTAKGEDFHKALDSYFTGLFTDEQQKAMTAAAAQREVQAGFDQMHISVPQTKADFIALVNSLDLTTESGQSTFATLMSLAESFGKVQDQAEAMHKAQLALNQDAQVRLLNATGQTDAGTILALQIQQANELADAQTKGLDTGALVLAQQAEMAQAQQKIADTAAAAAKALSDSRQKLQIQILNLSGDTAGATALQRQMELAAMDASLRPLQERIYALQDEAAAAKTATDAAKATQDAAKKATTDAMAVLQKSVTAAKTAAQSVYDAQIAGIDAAKQAQADAFKVQEKAAQDYVSKLQTVAGSIKSTLDGLTAPGSDTLMARKFAESQISMYARSSRLPMNGELDGALKTISQPSEGLFSSSVDYRRDYVKTAADLTTLNNRAQGQLTNAQLQLQAMQDANELANKAFDAQTKAAKDALDQQNAALDATLAKAQAQIDAVNGTTVAVMSVDAAINNLASALQAQSSLMHLINPTLATPNTPSFAVGNPYVSQDMNANIHQGEIVMDRMSAEVLRRYGIPTNGAADNRELIAEVKALRSDLRAANGEIAAANKKMARYIERWDGDGMPDVRTA